MGSDWSWTSGLPPGPLTEGVVEELLSPAEGAGFSPHRSLDGLVNAFRPDDPVEHDPGCPDRGAVFGRVDDDWSVLQAHRLPTGPAEGVPPPGLRPELPGWWTYFGPDLHRDPPPLPADFGATVRRVPGGGVVVGFLDDPAAGDELAFEALHLRFRAWARTSVVG